MKLIYLKNQLVVVFLLLIGIIGWGQNKSYTFPKIKSNIALPVSISVNEINSLINQSVTGVLYEDNSYTDNNNDQFKVKVEKDGNIDIVALKGNRLLISIPLKVWAEQGYGTMGYYVYQDTNFKVIMNFITSIDTNADWTLKTETKSNGFDWTKKPVLDYGKVKLPIASTVETSLTEQQNKFTKIIDDKIKESFDLKPYLLTVWNNFNSPINISEEYNTWLKLTPQSVYLTPIKIYSDVIKTTVGLDLYSETFIGQIPSISTPIKYFPNYKLRDEIPTEFNLQTTANISFEDATTLAKAQFVGQEFELTDAKSKVKITDISMYAESQFVVLEAQTVGKINGTTIIKGIPYYDAEKKRIALRETDVKLKTSNLFQKALIFLFEGKVRKMIETEYGIPLADMEEESRKNLLISFNKEYYPGFFLKGRLLDFQPSEVLLFQDFMTVVIDTKATLQMDVEKLNF